jgi:hypothetical protein
VLNGPGAQNGDMTENQDTTRKGRIRSSLRHIWQDTTNASRAQFRRPPYDDYLQHERYTH